jgi:pimeloyl-ACP methyl ester carboxylesterase
VSAGTLFLVGGINDVVLVAHGWRRFLAADLPHALEVIAWQQGLWAVLSFADLWRTAHHRLIAGQLADRLRAARRAGPVHVLAHSAGTAITAYALERLDPAEPVTSAVLVCSALSPTYDLSEALRRTSYGILSVESWLDNVFLGIGTSLLGTADRRWGPSAGMVGFHAPSDPDQAAKLHQLRWTPKLVRQGWLGGHLSIGSPWFVRGTLAAWVRQAEGGTSGSGLRANDHSATG